MRTNVHYASCDSLSAQWDPMSQESLSDYFEYSEQEFNRVVLIVFLCAGTSKAMVLNQFESPSGRATEVGWSGLQSYSFLQGCVSACVKPLLGAEIASAILNGGTSRSWTEPPGEGGS